MGNKELDRDLNIFGSDDGGSTGAEADIFGSGDTADETAGDVDMFGSDDASSEEGSTE